jgi:hypothetical protein
MTPFLSSHSERSEESLFTGSILAIDDSLRLARLFAKMIG